MSAGSSLPLARAVRNVFNIYSPPPCRFPSTICDPVTTYVCNSSISSASIYHYTPLASPVVWQIELHNGVDNRLVKSLINDALKPALQIVEREWRKERAEGKAKKNKNAGAAALVIVGRLDQEKFFSNGAPDLP